MLAQEWDTKVRQRSDCGILLMDDGDTAQGSGLNTVNKIPDRLTM